MCLTEGELWPSSTKVGVIFILYCLLYFNMVLVHLMFKDKIVEKQPTAFFRLSTRLQWIFYRLNFMSHVFGVISLLALSWEGLIGRVGILSHMLCVFRFLVPLICYLNVIVIIFDINMTSVYLILIDWCQQPLFQRRPCQNVSLKFHTLQFDRKHTYTILIRYFSWENEQSNSKLQEGNHYSSTVRSRPCE